jgi:hypothetical protein
MIAPLAKLMDWSAIQIAALMSPKATDDLNATLEEALQFVTGPDFIRAVEEPANVEFRGCLRFQFPTPRPGRFAENNVAHGRFYRVGERWRERPAIILLHGNGDALNYNHLFPRIARQCNQEGLSAATLAAPYFFQRRPRELGGSLGYADCLQFAEATAQAVAEIRALTGWLLGEGCPGVALWGYSMGAWYAGISACCDVRLAAVVLGAPCSRMRPWVQMYTIWPRIRRELPKSRERCEALNQTSTNLTLARPAIAREKILLIEGVYDLMCPKQDVEDLWQAWAQPDIWRLPYGHTGICGGCVPGLSGRVLDWLAPRLEVKRKNVT